jgi:hypothetical protein
MGVTMTHTYAILEINHDLYEEIANKLRTAGYTHLFHRYADDKPPDMALSGIYLRDGGNPRDPPLLQCIDCTNTASPASALARDFNKGRCMFCGGYFKVIRA